MRARYLQTAFSLAMFAVAGNAAGLSVDQGTLRAGTPVSLSVRLSAGGDAPNGVQFDLNYDAAGAVAILRVSRKGLAESGELFPVRIKAPSGTDRRAERLTLAGNDGSVKIETRRNGQ